MKAYRSGPQHRTPGPTRLANCSVLRMCRSVMRTVLLLIEAMDVEGDRGRRDEAQSRHARSEWKRWSSWHSFWFELRGAILCQARLTRVFA
jgi:hypothetical protein